MRKRRQRAGGDIVPIEIETDKDIDKDIEKDKDLELKTDREAGKKELPVCPSDGDNKLYISFGNDKYEVNAELTPSGGYAYGRFVNRCIVGEGAKN